MKDKTRFLTIVALIFVAFSVIAFVCPFVKNGAFWIAYLFGVAALALQIVAWPKAFGGVSAKSKFYGFPIARVAVIYLIAQLVLSLIFMAAAKVLPVWVPVVIGILLLCAALIGLITADATRDEIQRQETQTKENTSAMKSLQAKINAIAANGSSEAKPALNALAEAFRFSDPVSSDATAAAEAKLAVRLDDLSDAVSAGRTEEVTELCKKITVLLQERNALCKANK